MHVLADALALEASKLNHEEKSMKLANFGIPILVLSISTGAASAQNAHTARSDILPKACQTGSMGQSMQSGPQMDQNMSNMHSNSDQMSGMQGMTDTQKGLHQAMMDLQPAMMQGSMAKDADVAWICSMIPHHQMAIEMARAGLKGADNAESKRLAEETIKSNEKDKAKLIDWVEKYASKESGNETTGSSKP